MARLVVVSGSHRGREFPLEPDQTIGRLATNQVTVDDKTMSRQHTRIWSDGAAWWIEDLGSRNGTELNGEKVDRERLRTEDFFIVGKTEFTFINDDEVAGDQPATTPSGFGAKAPASPRPLSSGDIEFGGPKSSSGQVKAVKDKNLSFSPHAGKSNQRGGFFGLDLAQEGGLGRFLLIGGVVAIAILVFWFTQDFIAGR